jgi:uncharacterized UBP type Zn finger protein
MFLICVHQVTFTLFILSWECNSLSSLTELQKTFAPKRKAIEEAEEKKLQQERERMKRKAAGDDSVHPLSFIFLPFVLLFLPFLLMICL